MDSVEEAPAAEAWLAWADERGTGAEEHATNAEVLLEL